MRIAGGALTTTTPTKTFAAPATTVTFNCRTSSDVNRIRWQFHSPSGDEKDPVRIHNGLWLLKDREGKFAQVFDLNIRQSILIIKSVDVNDTGTYTCLEANTTSFRINFTLQVTSKLRVDDLNAFYLFLLVLREHSL